MSIIIEIFTHGASKHCPQVMSGEWTRCRGHRTYKTNGSGLEEKVRLAVMRGASSVVDPVTALQEINHALAEESPGGFAVPPMLLEELKETDQPEEDTPYALDTDTSRKEETREGNGEGMEKVKHEETL